MKKLTFLALIAIVLASCNQVNPKYPFVIINISDYDVNTKTALFSLDYIDKVGFNKSDVTFRMPIGNYKIGDTLKFK